MIAEKIRILRTERNMSQSELARKLGLSRNGVNSWEQSLSAPSLTYLVELAKFFHVTTDYLLGLSERTSIDVVGLSEEDIALISDIASRLRRDSGQPDK
jgi:transcriptional regulator with XRE-family HTH domain